MKGGFFLIFFYLLNIQYQYVRHQMVWISLMISKMTVLGPHYIVDKDSLTSSIRKIALQDIVKFVRQRNCRQLGCKCLTSEFP